MNDETSKEETTPEPPKSKTTKKTGTSHVLLKFVKPVDPKTQVGARTCKQYKPFENDGEWFVNSKPEDVHSFITSELWVKG